MMGRGRGSRGDGTAQAMDLSARVLACAGLDDLLNELLPELGDFFGAETACGFELHQDPDRPWLGRSAVVNIQPAVMNRYNDDFVTSDPICGSAFTAAGDCRLGRNDARLMRVSDGRDRGNREHEIYMEDFLHREHLDHVFGIMLRPSIDTAPLVVLGFHRDGHHSNFSAHDFDRARLILPSLLSRIDNFALRARLQANEARAGGGYGSRCYDLAVAGDGRARIDRLDTPAASRPAAERLFHPGLLARLASLREGSSRVGDERRLLTAIGADDLPDDYRVTVRRRPAPLDGHRVELEIAPPPSRDILVDFARAEGFSGRETDVVRALVEGRRNSEIAEGLGLSVRTVENHLRSVFAKAAVTSRTQLLRKLAVAEDSAYV